MGNEQSDKGAKDFFGKLGGGLESILNKGTNQMFETMSMPQKLMSIGTKAADGAVNFLSSPRGGILIPIMCIGGLYIAVQLVKK